MLSLSQTCVRMMRSSRPNGVLTGPVDTKLRIFLVLALPAHRRGQITVAGETRPWREGEAIIFDDSLEHWVAFDAEPTAQRIVLVVDVPHPDLRGTTNR